ncbi:unnamed protein product, partial [Mesorhabditis belari]|uniref:C-type lectin domain-containing protein n=1 Tax=Mesorhabditis belari TaxID=2138241 RepID=A0AAF3FET2_9BILA
MNFRLISILLCLENLLALCPKSSVPGSIEKTCFFGVASGFSFSKGDAFCEDFDGHLASVTNSDDNEKVLQIGKEIVEQETAVWLGGVYDGKNVSWLDGSSDVYQNFDAGTLPGNMIMNLTNGKWTTASWNEKLPIVCVSRDQTVTEPPVLESPCPTEWFYVAQLQNCYKPIYNVDFTNAIATCRSMDAALVSIHSEEENRIVDDLTKCGRPMDSFETDLVLIGGVWLGPSKSEYGWSDGSPWNYSKWELNGQPLGRPCSMIYPDAYSNSEADPSTYLHRWTDYIAQTQFEKLFGQAETNVKKVIDEKISKRVTTRKR